MILSLISLSLVISSMIFLIIPIFLQRKRENIAYKLKAGEICYRCKSNTDFNIWDPDPLTGKINLTDFHQRLCKSCERDIKLNSVLDKKELIIFGSSKSIKLQQITVLLSAAFNIAAIVFKPLGIIGGSLLFISMYFSYRNYLATSRPKAQS